MGKHTAFIFPGQGSQAPGMGADLFEHYPEYQATLQRASDVLGYDMAALCFEGPAEKLAKTEYTQPAIFVSSAATLAILKERLAPPHVVAGHSLGEYAACLAAGLFDLESGVSLVAKRAELMEQAACEKPGKMFALLGADISKVERVVAEFDSGIAAVANYNSPAQVVVAVEASASEALAEELKQTGAKRIVELSVGGAFHSPLMDHAAEKFAAFIDGIKFTRPVMPVLLNGSASPSSDPGAIKEALSRQFTGPVRWTQSVERMHADGVSTFIEVGPGQVLAKMSGKMFGGAEFLSTGDDRRLKETLQKLSPALSH